MNLRKIVSSFLLCASVYSVSAENRPKTPADYVNPLVGTALKNKGGLVPFIGHPFAMTNFVPQTRENKMGRTAYVYDDSQMIGFLASHQPTIWMGDYGYVSVMPQIGNLAVKPEDRAMPFSHENEQVSPYYYSVLLGDKQKIKGEMSAASHAGILKFTFPQKKARIIVQGINLNPDLTDWCNDYKSRLDVMKGYIKIDLDRNEIIGWNPDRQSAQLGPDLPNFNGYFVIQFNCPISKYGVWDRDVVVSDVLELEGLRMGAYVEFDLSGKKELNVKVGTSFISIDQARANLNKEIPHWEIKQVAADAKIRWNEKLSKITPGQSVSEQSKRILYTALYHCYLFPRTFSEDGNYYSPFDDKVHKGISYNDYSLWDTFRAYHPLMTILEPELTGNWITSLLQMYQEGGWLPIWPNPAYTNIMIGTHADAVIADAYMKGIRNYDEGLAYEAIRKNAFEPPVCDTKRRYGDRDRWTDFEGRAGASFYHSLGYIPVDKTNESVSRTLEYTFDDWCVAQVAKSMGRMYDYDRLMLWTDNYQNLYNRETGFMAPRYFNGKFVPSDKADQGMTEGSKWTYLFCVLHDIPGMIEMMGGNAAFSAKLDANFDGAHYRHDNEPGHHYIYLYNYCGKPWRTQELVRKTIREKYHDSPDGLCGNDDCGQMSAWYLFGIMGFYPVTPASNLFALGAPQLSEITIDVNVPNGNKHPVKIIAENLSETNLYVESVFVDGKMLHEPFLSYEQLVAADEIKYVMSPHPNYD